MAVDQESRKLLHTWEGCPMDQVSKRCFVYDDKVKPTRPYREGEKVIGTLTIGRGHAIFTKAEYEKYKKGITLAEADALFEKDLLAREAFIDAFGLKALKPHERGALVCFYYNCPSAFVPDKHGNGATFGKLLKQGKVLEALAHWTEYTRSGSTPRMLGLIRRRTSELILFTTGVFVHV